MKSVLGIAAIAACAGIAAADDISSANGFAAQMRVFNDFPTSILHIGPAGSPFIPVPAPGNVPLAPLATGATVDENFPAGTIGNFANKHQLFLSNNGGASPLPLTRSQSFTVSTTVTIQAPAEFPRKEGGIIMYNDRGGGFLDEGRVLVASDGEVAVFGANQSFTGFGNIYTLGTTASLTYEYFAPGTNGPLAQYRVTFIDAVTGFHSSGLKDFDPGSPDANGLNNGSVFGFVAQNQRNPLINDHSVITYGHVSVIPTPSVLALLGMAGLASIRRRR